MKIYFKSNLTYLRKRDDITQQELANQLEKGQSTVAGWENGASEPSIELLVKIASLFKISVDQLLTHDLASGNLIESLENRENEQIGNLKGNLIGNLNQDLNQDLALNEVEELALMKQLVSTLKSIDMKFTNYLENKEKGK